ncbi:hemin-degrading factor [Pseudodonghicola sp.]|uniref:hemin-degrading factor n=1 Tax=Pseudodonghicola sp. TaxID=1969463 RepID=UPI003A971193
MPTPPVATPDEILEARAANPKMRARDLAASLKVTEAALVAANVDRTVTRIDANPDALIPAIETIGEVMALTRNESAVHERTGSYENFKSGPIAGMVLGSEIDLRIFPTHWANAFAVVEDGDQGTKRSLQIFDHHGDAVHKVHLKPASDVMAFEAAVKTLATGNDDRTYATTPRPAPEGVQVREDNLEILRKEWDRMTDTHQFLRLTAKLKFNRLGAYRMAGAPYAEKLSNDSVSLMLERAATQAVPLMIFVGNAGCIQIHSGLVQTIKPMGPWQNVLDPRFNLHLRADHIAEVWRVRKPTQRGPAISVECFDAEGQLILQSFGVRQEGGPLAWNDLVDGLPKLEAAEALA